MPDPNFHRRGAALTLGEIAKFTDSQISGDAAYVVEDVAPLETAGAKNLSFLDNVKYREHFKVTKAGACIVHPELAGQAPKGINLLLSKAPYKAYALAAQKFYPLERTGSVAKTATIDPTAKLGKNCTVEPGAYIGPHVQIGDDCRIGANAVITHAIIGNDVNIYPGACIGQDGFGFAPDAKGHVKVPQLGRVIIGDHVEIGANCTIDRGSAIDTVIGDGTWLDNMVHIAHNVQIGKGCMIAGQVGMAGSAVIGDFVAMGGQAGINGHLKIGKGARIAAKSGVTRNVPDGAEYMGYPAVPMRKYLRGVAVLNRLIKKEKSS